MLVPFSFEIREMLSGIGPLIENNNEVVDRSAKACPERRVAFRAFGGPSASSASAVDRLTSHRLVGAVTNDVAASSPGGSTIPHGATA